jgi:hypothetical protein
MIDRSFFLFNNMIEKIDDRKTEHQPNAGMFFQNYDNPI